MSDAPSPDSPPVTGEDLLPPVEPPSAGFIVQLFIVPALIVLGIVLAWMMFQWLVHRTTARPEALIQGLQGSSVARWQRANDLAEMMQGERYADFKESAAAAAQLATILDREIDAASEAGGMKHEAVVLRYFLCRILGEFRTEEALEVLLKAATTNRDPAEQSVRRGAIEAIAVLSYNLRQLDPPRELSHPDLEPTLFQLAEDADDLIRSETAFVLGRLGTPAFLERLKTMVDDPHTDTRYNGAIALAQHGDALAIETLAEMLDIEELGSIREETTQQSQIFKRALILKNAMQAARELANRNPTADLSEVILMLKKIVQADVEQLREAKVHAQMVSEARRTLEALEP